MKSSKFSTITLGACALALAALSVSCTTPSKQAATPDAPKIKTPTASALPTLHIKAGVTDPLTDSKGTVWSADTGFEGGTDIDRKDPGIAITGTDRPEIYQAERYSMDSWSAKVPNGVYTLKLHFSEDYDGITGPTDRIFTYTVKDGPAATGKVIKEVKDFSPWKAAGDHLKAYVDAIPVTVTNGELSVTFTSQTENPQINAIELIPK